MSDGGKGSARRPGTGFEEGITRIIGERCVGCRGRRVVAQKAPNPADPPELVPCPLCSSQGEPYPGIDIDAAHRK